MEMGILKGLNLNTIDRFLFMVRLNEIVLKSKVRAILAIDLFGTF